MINGVGNSLLIQNASLGKPLRERPHDNPVAEAKLEYNLQRGLQQARFDYGARDRVAFERAAALADAQRGQIQIGNALALQRAGAAIPAPAGPPLAPQPNTAPPPAATPPLAAIAAVETGITGRGIEEAQPRADPAARPAPPPPRAAEADGGAQAAEGERRLRAEADRAAEESAAAERESRTNQLRDAALLSREERLRAETIQIQAVEARLNELRAGAQQRVSATYNFAQFARQNPVVARTVDTVA